MSRPEPKLRDLSKIRGSSSTSRVLDLHHVYDRYGEEQDYQENPLFKSERLNQALIIKHTLRPHELDDVSNNRQTATKVAIPLSRDDLKLGAFSFFCEQHNFEDAFDQAIGEDVGRPEREHDMTVLREIAALPSFDPYLLSERLRMSGITPSRLYFDISDADAANVETYVVEEISWLVEMAYDIAGPEAKQISNKLARMIMRNERSTALNPLRDTLRLDEHSYDQGMFGWKGVLYYKWLNFDLGSRMRRQMERLRTVRFVRAHAEDQRQLELIRASIIRSVAQNFQRASDSLADYDNAFSKFADLSDVKAFRAFILRAPDLFNKIGEELATVQHVTSLWEYRQPESEPNRIEVDDAYDLFREFAAALGHR